jgi:phosphate transport system substrate-binding protein
MRRCSGLIIRVLAIMAAACMAVSPAYAQDVTGAGSTFVAPILTKWADDYARVSGVKVDYQAVGSGAGIQKIEGNEVDFGATDKPMEPAELRQRNLCQFPVVVGAVVAVVNLPGVAPGKIRLSGPLVADIYLGKVHSWNDPQIQDINPDLRLPAMPITVVHRSDGSGTTYNWLDYLAKLSPEWKNKVGVGLIVNWPVGVGGKGNAGIAAAVQQTRGAIGYVEYAFALQNKLTYAQLSNSDGLFVLPSPDTFEAAASAVRWKDYEDFAVLMTNAGGGAAYPVTATTFVLMPKAPADIARSSKALAFFKWALENGDKQATELNYVPLPPELIALIEKYWASHIKGSRPSE